MWTTRDLTSAASQRGPRLPPGYRLDESAPDVLVLRGPGGWAASYFSVWGATVEKIEKAAWEDYKGPPTT